MAGEPSLGRGKGPQNNLGDGTLGGLTSRGHGQQWGEPTPRAQ
jgi:hypothetical protein